MSDASSGSDPVELLAEEFLRRHRQGESPTVSEYVAAHPELADRIRRLFPAIALMENLGDTQRPNPGISVIPEVLGEYRLIREIGRGGMGVVFEARQESLGRHVALKILPDQLFRNATFQERFQREARSAARLHHPNIVPVFGVGEHAGVPYYAMQFIRGRGVDEFLMRAQRQRGQAPTRTTAHRTYEDSPVSATGNSTRQEPPSSGLGSPIEADYFRGIARCGLQVAEALAYAHGQGVLHRDIKPSNILIDAAGKAWVTDFGLAKSQEDVELTQSGDILGTVRYMAPERFRGESTTAVDVYALGVTLYELVTVRPAYLETDRARLLDLILHSEPPAPRTLDRRIPRDLETIVLKAMARESRDRYRSAELMAEDLRRFLADRPIAARRTPKVERAWRFCRRNPVLATVAGLALALLMVILIGSPVMSVRLYEQRQAALEQLWDTHLARAAAHQTSHEAGRRFAGLASLEQAYRLLSALPHSSGRVRQLRNQFIACLSLDDLGETPRAGRHFEGNVAICYDAALSRYALGDDRGTISIRRTSDDSELLQLPGLELGAWALKFSPNGRYLAAGYRQKYRSRSERFRVWDLLTGRAVVQVDSETGCGEADFTSDDRYVAFGRDAATLAFHDLVNGGEPPLNVTVPGLPQAIAFSPDGNRVAVAGRRSVDVRDISSGRVLAAHGHESDGWAIAWHPSGKFLAAASGAAINLWEPGQPQPLAVLTGHERVVYGLAFNRRGTVLASKAQDNTVRLWDVAVRRPLVQATSVYVGCTPLVFGPDDMQLACGSDGRAVWLWDVLHGNECRTLAVPNAGGKVQSLTGRFSGDGTWLAVGCNDGVRFWRTGHAECVGHIPGVNCWAVPFRPDGTEWYTSSRLGVHRWEFRRDGDTQRLGPPKRMLTGQPSGEIDITPDGRVLVARRRDASAVIVSLGEPKLPNVTVASPMLMRVAVSADGQWLASGALMRTGVTVWNATTGELFRELPVESAAAVRFSPASHRLAVGTERDYSIWDTDSWHKLYSVDRQPESESADSCFSGDGRHWVIRKTPSRLQILDTATGELLAEFPTPDGHMLVWHTLSPDGRYLAAGGYKPVIYLWDLYAIRRPLADRGLDWRHEIPKEAMTPTPARLVIEGTLGGG